MNAVLFDLDGTLWHSPRPPDFDAITTLQATAIARVFASAGSEAFVRAFWAEWQRQDAVRSAEDLRELEWSSVMGAVCTAHSIRVSHAEARRIWEAINGVPHTAFHREPMEHAVATLNALKTQGWRTGIVTNHPVEAALLRPHLEACGLGAYVDVVVTSADTGMRKPHAQPFLCALEALQIAAADAMMVGDSIENDIVPAKELGMMPVHLSAGEGWGDERVGFQIRTLAELPGLLPRASR